MQHWIRRTACAATVGVATSISGVASAAGPVDAIVRPGQPEAGKDAEAMLRNDVIPSAQVDLRQLGIPSLPQGSYIRRDPWRSEIGIWLEQRPSWMVGVGTLVAGKPPSQRARSQRQAPVKLRPWVALAGTRAMVGLRIRF